jgi:hypothetical protein
VSFFRRFFRRRRRSATAPILEQEAYARLHGERGSEIVSVVAVERKPIPRRTGDMSGELLRRAFEAKLDARTAAH